jgi:hypothetical protein
VAALSTFVLRTAQALKHQHRGDLLMQISKALDERLPLLGMMSVKMLNEARSNRLWARPALEAFAVAVIAGFNFGQHGQHALCLCGQSTAIRLRQGCCFVRRDA